MFRRLLAPVRFKGSRPGGGGRYGSSGYPGWGGVPARSEYCFMSGALLFQCSPTFFSTLAQTVLGLLAENALLGSLSHVTSNCTNECRLLSNIQKKGSCRALMKTPLLSTHCAGCSYTNVHLIKPNLKSHFTATI